MSPDFGLGNHGRLWNESSGHTVQQLRIEVPPTTAFEPNIRSTMEAIASPQLQSVELRQLLYTYHHGTPLPAAPDNH